MCDAQSLGNREGCFIVDYKPGNLPAIGTGHLSQITSNWLYRFILSTIPFYLFVRGFFIFTGNLPGDLSICLPGGSGMYFVPVFYKYADDFIYIHQDTEAENILCRTIYKRRIRNMKNKMVKH